MSEASGHLGPHKGLGAVRDGTGPASPVLPEGLGQNGAPVPQAGPGAGLGPAQGGLGRLEPGDTCPPLRQRPLGARAPRPTAHPRGTYPGPRASPRRDTSGFQRVRGCKAPGSQAALPEGGTKVHSALVLGHWGLGHGGDAEPGEREDFGGGGSSVAVPQSWVSGGSAGREGSKHSHLPLLLMLFYL